MKVALLFFFSCCLLSIPLNGQFSADFSDGSLDAWQGDKANFIVNPAFQLQLAAPSGSSSSWIYTPVSYIDSMTWELYFRLDFAPSTTNQLRIFLGMTSTDLASGSGYFLEIGATGDQDALEFKYRDSGTDFSIASSAPALVGTEPVDLHLRVIKRGTDEWSFYSLAGTLPELLFTANHNLLALNNLSWFGFHCRYSDTRRDKFFFDDIVIQPVMADVVAPTWISVNVLNDRTVALLFDEPLDESTVLQAENYILTPGITSPIAIDIVQPNIILQWDEPFTSQVEYTLTIEQLKDLAGNAMVSDQKTFTYIDIKSAQPYELLITEIMADPSPVIGLPDAEYLEIYHAGSGIFNLADYMLMVGSSVRTLPEIMISGGEYIILCASTDVSAFSAFGRVVGLSSFPSLTNSGATVKILDQQEVILHEVSYDLSWYRDPAKDDGGWSLEMLNPEMICADRQNWSAANNLLGGTPGSVNSTWTTSPDTAGPSFLSLFTAAPDTLLLRFDERLDPLLVENTAAYMIQPPIGILSAVVTDPKTVELALAENLQSEVVYTLLPFDIFDCQGNVSMITDTISFGLTAAAAEGDLLINEILFNPASGGSRFIEVVNASQKFIDLQTLAIARLKPGQNDIYATGISEIIAPGELVVFTPNPSDILLRYQVPFPSKLLEASLPSWDDKSDNVTLLITGEVIDSVTYTSDWHLPVIADQNGVSLERVSTTSATSHASNWHSAASTAGYATPTGVNSQEVILSVGGEKPYTITNRQFSPDGDGYKDFLALNFLLSSGTEIGSVWIYDLEGRQINTLLDNESLGTSTLVQWDGRTSVANLAEMGIYIIFVQLWDANGNAREYQETCALVKR